MTKCKCNSVASFNFRANASMVLERQLRKIDSTVSGFEKQLSDDGVIPDKPSAIQIRTQEIQVNTYFILNLVERILITTSCLHFL